LLSAGGIFLYTFNAMVKDTLYAVWQQLQEPYTENESLIEREFQVIADRYSAPQRHYHTLDHVYALLQLQLAHADVISDNENFLHAIFFHDIVYDVTRSDNEERSAIAAADFLRKTSYPVQDIAAVMSFIHATKTHVNIDGNPDLDYFLDFDLSILSVSPDAYAAYVRQIREEFSVYPNEVFNTGRKKVLQQFIQSPFIYKTETFRKEREAIARQNILAELKALE
jgi:predicted metal-dependent HD superfamily phosphohydrolase